MKFSIITPAYNSYSKMQKYFKSLENQTYKDFEVIIVDDCSTDNTYNELIQYKKKSKLNLKIIENKKNTGPGPARNIALQKINGDYITFIDSDDYIDNTTLERIANILDNDEFDSIIFDYNRVNKNEIKKGNSIPGFSEGKIDSKTAIAVATGSTWCKVYKAEIIHQNNVKFPNITRFEDMVFNKLALSFCNKIYYLKENLYNYVHNQDSIVNNSKNINEKFVIKAFEILENKMSKEYTTELEAIFVRELLYSMSLMMLYRGIEKRVFISEMSAWKNRYPNWYKNKYIKYFSKHHKLCLFFIKINFVNGLKILSYFKFNR